MSAVSVATAMIGAQQASTQGALAAKMMRMNADAQSAIAQVVDSVAQNAQRLSENPAGVGQKVDISV